MPAIEIRGLTKDFPLPERGQYVRAVDGLNLSIETNTVFGLLGPNGSGKSTTIRILLGLSQASRGAVSVLGGDPRSEAVRARVGYLPDAPYYYRFLSGWELLQFFGKLLGMQKGVRESRASELLERFGLGDAARRKVGAYSKGMLQRLGFAQALLGDPEVVILDEPTAGVDPVGAAEVGDFVLDLKREGKTILLCSHLLAQVQDLCDRVGILNKGRLLAEGSLADLLGSEDSRSLHIRNLDAASRARIEAIAKASGAAVSQGQERLDQLFRELVQGDERSRQAS